jgi:virginiamycin B lyase
VTRRCLLISGVLVEMLALAPSAHGFVYWANNNTIGRANLDGSGVNQSFIAGAGGSGLAANAGHVYWSGSGAIGRADLNGSSSDPSFVTGASGPVGVAVDGAHLYWVNFNAATIGRAPLAFPNGPGKDQGFVTGLNQSRGVAVSAAHLYWTNLLDNSEIGRANVDGTGATNGFLPASLPTAVAVDAAHVYWTNSNTGTIGRAGLDGSNPDQSFIVTGASDLEGVAVDGSHVYWTDTGEDEIGRANLDGSNPNPSFIVGATTPRGLAVDGLSVPSCQHGALSTEHAAPIPVALQCSSGGGARTYSIASGPSHGEISGFSLSAGTLTYTPDRGFSGTDSFRFAASNAGATSPIATATIQVAPAPRIAPVPNDFTFGALTLNKKNGTARLAVEIPGAGGLELAETARVKGASASAAAAGEVTLIVKAKGRARRKLRNSGKARVTAEVTFAPIGGAPSAQATSLRLVKK